MGYMFFGPKLGWVAFVAVCVVAMVLFPAPSRHAPFNAVYGPTTDLRSSVDVGQALPLILGAAMVTRSVTLAAPAHQERADREFATTHAFTASPLSIVLRC